MVAEIAAEIDQDDTRIFLHHRQRDLTRVVGRAVIDKHDLVVAIETLGATRNALAKLRDLSSGIVHCCDDGQLHETFLPVLPGWRCSTAASGLSSTEGTPAAASFCSITGT